MAQTEAGLEAFPIQNFMPTELPSGTKAWHRLYLFTGVMGPVIVPVAVARGVEPGPLVVVAAGVHGDEFEGMEAIRQVFQELYPEAMKGTFVGVPVVNPFAYEGQMRETPPLWDGLNLARQFPGRNDGSLTQLLAGVWFDWMTRIMGENDLFIDFHSAGTRYEYLPMVAFHATGDENASKSHALAAAFGMDRIWRIPDRPDTRITFNGSISRRGIPTIATEVRGRGGIVESDVEELKAGLRNIIRHKGMLCNIRKLAVSDQGKRQPTWSTEWAWIHTAGLFLPYVGLDQQIKAGQPLGKIISVTGELLNEVRAPVGGRIWGIRTFSTVQPGDYVFLIGFEEETNR